MQVNYKVKYVYLGLYSERFTLESVEIDKTAAKLVLAMNNTLAVLELYSQLYNDCPEDSRFSFLPDSKPFDGLLQLATTDRYFHKLACHVESDSQYFDTFGQLSQFIVNLGFIFEKVFNNLCFPVDKLLLDDFENLKYTLFQKLTNQVADIFLMKSCKFDLILSGRPTITVMRLITLKYPRFEDEIERAWKRAKRAMRKELVNLSCSKKGDKPSL